MKNLTHHSKLYFSKLSLLLLCIASIFITRHLILNKIFSMHSYFGSTMGTTFSIKVSNSPLTNSQWAVHKKNIDSKLKTINNIFSNYIPHSELSKLNRNKTINLEIEISEQLFKVLTKAKEIYKDTNGAFDVTIAPLIDLWGFGDEKNKSFPNEQLVKKTLKLCGMNKLTLKPPNKIIKAHPEIKINLSAIAKGYGVDAISNYLALQHFKNYIVEIGGEIFCKGEAATGKPWRIGIDTPDPDLLPGQKVHGVVNLQNLAIATSGNYRQFFKNNGKSYTHIINPKTGYPAQTNLVSVSIIAKTCMEADAYATSLYLMDPNDALNIIQNKPNIETYMIVRNKNGSFSSMKSEGFEIVI